MERYAGAGPLSDYEVGQRVLTKEGFPGTVDDILEGPGDLTTLWVSLDNGMGGGEYAEAEVQPLNQQQAQLASVEHTARDDYPELGSILTDRLPPQITRSAAKQGAAMVHCDTCDVDYPIDSEDERHEHSKTATSNEARDWNDADREDIEPGETFLDPPYDEDLKEASAVATHLALYLPPKAEADQAASTTDLSPAEKVGYDDGLAHGKEGITRDPANPADPAYMAGYEIGWAEGVLVKREPANSWNTEDLDAQQVAEVPAAPISTTTYSMLDRLEEMERRGAPKQAGAIMDFLKGHPDPNGAYTDPGHRFSFDWCRFRRNSHCWLSKDLNEEASKQAGYAVWNPVDRGICPRISWESQQKCPVGEPGPHAGQGGFTDATIPWDQGGQRGGVPSNVVRASKDDLDGLQSLAAFEVTATWADVRRKAKRIRSEGGVRVVAVKHGDEVVAHVKGDHGIYETTLRRNPGRHNVAYWHCGCKWGAYSWGRSPQYKRFEGRMCSHALALQYEAQARSMFGRGLTLDEKQPAWMDQKHVHLPGDYRRDLKRYTSLEVSSLREVDASYDPDTDGQPDSPAIQFATAMLSTGAKYAEVRPVLLALGAERPVEIIKAARTQTFRGKVNGEIKDLLIDDDGHVHDQHSGEHVDHFEVVYPGWDPAYGLNINDTKLGAKADDGPSVSGVVLKAADTGRVLMLQRSMDDDKASGKWEWPGGHHEDGDLTSLHAAIREWQEEVGQPFPSGGYVAHTWTSPNGVYQGHLVVIPSEKDLVLHEGRIMENPDDPNSEACEQVAWWEVPDARKNPALRQEVKDTTPWSVIEKAASLDVPPSTTAHYIGHGDSGNAVVQSDKPMEFTGGASLPDLSDFFGGKPSTRVVDASASRGVVSSSGFPVHDVVHVSSGQPVPGVLAGRIVAGVPDLEISERADVELVPPAVGGDHLGASGFSPGSVPEVPVPLPGRGPGPRVTGIRTPGSVDVGFVSSDGGQSRSFGWHGLDVISHQATLATTAKTADAPKDPEFEKQHPRDDEGKFTAAARAMLKMAQKNEPKTTSFLQDIAKRTGGKMEGLDYRFKSEESLLRKMRSEAHEHGGDPGKTAANMSDTLRYTTVFEPDKYTEGVNSTLAAMKKAGYRMRVKNYWGRGDPYNGINVAAMTPTGHPFELQFHTPDSLKVKEKTIHKMYEEWRKDDTPESRRAQLAAQMRDAIDMVHRPSGALGIENRKRQPLPGNVPGYHLQSAASLPNSEDGYYYLSLHTHDSDEPLAVMRSNGKTVEVWRDGTWVQNLDYGRFFFKGEPRTEPISPEDAAEFISGGKTAAKSKDRSVPPSEHGDPRLQDAGVSVSQTKDGKYYVHTHRARGKYRDSVADIPDSEIKFIRSTGVRKTADEDQCPACGGDSMGPYAGGDYHCMDCGHDWNENDAAARAFHGDGPLSGIPLGQFVDIPDLMTARKEATMDTPDEFGSLFDEMPIDPRRTAAVQNDPGTCPGFGVPGIVDHGDEWSLDVSSGFVVADLHDEPEPALPTTDGAEEDEEDPQHVAQRLTAALGHPARARRASTPKESAEERGRRLLAYVDASLAGYEVDGPNPFAHIQAGQADNEIAAAAANHLATKQALKTYDRSERQAIINEGEGGEPAANLDRLDITGTHYEALDQARAAKSDDEDLWMLGGDPNGMD